MSGETSKEIGEYGEKVVYRLLDYFGWTPILKNIDVECLRPELHERKSKKHGIDYLKHYKCPVQSNTQKTVVVSAKYYKDYPVDPTSKIKEFLLDLGKAMFCIKPNAEYGKKRIDRTIKDQQMRGLLIYLNHSGDFRDTVLDKIKQFRISSFLIFDPIFIIDNRRATFFYSIIEYIRRVYPKYELQFYYSETEYNLDNLDNSSCGRILPLEYLVSDIIPIRIDLDKERKELLVFSNNPFSKKSLSRLVNFCKSITNVWNSKNSILFSDYRELQHIKDVESLLSTIEETSFSKSISVNSFPLIDFRKLEEN